MLAELAAANSAFQIIKQTVAHGRDLATAGKAINDFVFAKEELRRRSKKKKNRLFKRSQDTSEFDEFMALEQIKKNEADLRSMMQIYGRAGLWQDWQKFQAEARKSRQTQEKLQARKRKELMETLLWSSGALVILICVCGLFYWVAAIKGLI
jgi:hypothetical protein